MGLIVKAVSAVALVPIVVGVVATIINGMRPRRKIEPPANEPVYLSERRRQSA